MNRPARLLLLVPFIAFLHKPARGDEPAPPSAVQIANAIDMITLPGGAFTMGVPESYGIPSRSPAHTVHIAPFKIGQYEVTYEQFDAFARATGRQAPDDEGYGRGDHPVANIRWADVQAFISWLNNGTERHFRLLSEAEWEYAARAGTTTDYWWGDDFDPNRLNSMVNEGRDEWAGPSPVDSFDPNPFGLYNVSGNVWEWVADCWHGNFSGAPSDGSVWQAPDCVSHVIRGGSWFLKSRASLIHSRAAGHVEMTSTTLGFRLAEDTP